MGVKSGCVWRRCFSGAACKEALCTQHERRVDAELQYTACATDPPRRLIRDPRWFNVLSPANKSCHIPQLHVLTSTTCRSHAAVGVVTARFLLPYQQGPSVNKEYLSQIQLYSIFSELTVVSNTVVIITVCVKVANSTFLVTNKRTKWAEWSRYYLCMLFCKVIFDYWRLTITR